MNEFDQAADMSTNRFDAVTEFPSHVEFARKLLESYEWDEENVRKFTAQLDALQAKHDDRFLNLSVIGEFSTGKSTFINALLRRNGFLESSSLQGTTTTATIIENSDGFALVLTYKDGNKDIQEFETCEELKERLASISIDAERASSLYSVTIQLPAPLLEKLGFRIIDTPGVNSNEHWHDDVTVRTIEEMSDLSIIIIDATKALPQQFCDFINSNLEHILGSCVFVVTKVNAVRKRELEEVIKYIKAKAQKEFNIDDPLVLPYSSTDILDNLQKLDNSIDLPELVAASLKSEKTMMEHMSSLKSIVQTLNLIKIADNIYKMLQSHLDKIAEKQKELMEKNEMIKSLPEKMSAFYNENIQMCRQMYNDAIPGLTDTIRENLQLEFRYSYSRIINEISVIASTADLYKYIETGFQITFSEEMRMRLYNVNTKSELVLNEYQKALSYFIDNFKKAFSPYINSEEIEASYSKYNFGYMCFPIIFHISLYIARFTKNRDILGTIIPKSIKDYVVAEGKHNFMELVNQCYTDAYYTSMNDISSYIANIGDQLGNTISSYLIDCQKYALNIINENNGQILDEQAKNIQADVSEINKRKEKLNVINQMLTLVSRKG